MTILRFVAADPVTDPVTTFTGLGVAGIVCVVLWQRGNEYKQERDHYRQIAENVLPAFTATTKVLDDVSTFLHHNDRNAEKIKEVLEKSLNQTEAALIRKALEDATRAYQEMSNRRRERE